MKWSSLSFALVLGFGCTMGFAQSAAKLRPRPSELVGTGLAQQFANPPDEARPGVYWYFLDGNQDRNEMIADLQAMKAVGIGSVLFLEVGVRVSPGPVPIMSDPWIDNVAHAFVEAGKLGMEATLGTGPGWSGSGGSWVEIGDSMQHLVGANVNVQGPAVYDAILPVPAPLHASKFSGMSKGHAAERKKWFRDVAVLAFPAPAGEPALIDQVVYKTIRDVGPYPADRSLPRFIKPLAAYPAVDAAATFDPARVIDLTPHLQADGRLRWDVPEGKWTIMRFVARSTGQTTRPAPRLGHGYECNKFSADSYRRHWQNFQQKILDRVIAKGGPLQPGRGLTTIHLDSWEMSSQNWTQGFQEQFRKRRGYDPLPFFPAWMGFVVGDAERTERFLFDMRLTAQELVLEEYASTIKSVAHEHGLRYSNEPYDMNPAGNIDLGSIADIPMCEFWAARVDTQYSCIEAASIANIMGRKIVKAESFTGGGFEATPAGMKNQTDWALAMGINGIVFHTFVHQAHGNKEKPGMTLGRYGTHWQRNQTFWDRLGPYHAYISRCSHILRQGEAVSDILYLTPEGAPHIFEPPDSATTARELGHRDKKGHAFDACTPRILAQRATVEGDRIAFPGGTRYRVLVLPKLPTMTPETLAVIDRLVREGATVIGNPPVKSPSLVGYPACDQRLATLATEMWQGITPPATASRITRGKGAIHWGGDLDSGEDLYPTYEATARLLAELGVAEDFSSPSGKLRYLHRRTDDLDIYFVSNRTAEAFETEGIFRVASGQPQLWDAVTGTIRSLGDYRVADGRTHIPLAFAPYQSCFIVFPRQTVAAAAPKDAAPNIPSRETVSTVEGPWTVSFDPDLGGPETATFETLVNWTARPEEGIKYYSGTAAYRTTFDVDLPDPSARGKARYWLDLGNVRDLCEVRLNGRNLGILWTAPWQLDVTDFLVSKGNRLEVDVVNTWTNRMIGDQQPATKVDRKVTFPNGILGGHPQPAGRYTFATYGFYRANARLTQSGLLGPVTLQSVTQQTR